MKLAKKMLACVMALALVAALAVTAFASSLAVTSTAAVVGENVVVTVSASAINGLEAGDITVKYDATALEYVSVEGKLAGATPAAGSPGAGEVTCSFMYLESATVDSDTVCVITFKALKVGSSEVTVEVGSWEGADQPSNVTASVVVSEAPTGEDPTTPTTSVDPTAVNPSTTKGNSITQTGEVGVAAIAGVMAIAAVAFVATRKKDEQ